MFTRLILLFLYLKGSNALDIKIPNLKRHFRKGLSGIVATSFFFTSPIVNYASDEIFKEVWQNVNENFFDGTYNDNDWNSVKEKNLKKLADGADERKIIEKTLGLLGDKYTRILDKQYFEALFKYDAIGVGLLFESNAGKQMVIAGPPITGSSADKAGLKKDDVVYSVNGKSTENGMTAVQLLDMLSNDEVMK